MRSFIIHLFSIALVISFAPLIGFSQSNIDSLQQVLKGDLPDTSRVKTLLNITHEYREYDIKKSLPFAEEALALAKQLKNPSLEASCYFQLSYHYSITGDFNTALKHDDLGLKAAIASKDSLKIATGYSNVGDSYYNLGKFDEAYFYFTNAYKVAKAIDKPLQMTIALYNVGKVFKELGQYDRALSHFKISEKLSKEIDDKEGEAYLLDEYGDMFIRTGKYDSALLTLKNSLAVSRKLDIDILKPKTLTKIARAYRRKKDFENSLAYYDTANTLYQSSNNQYGIAEVRLGQGIILIDQEDYAEGLQKVEESLVIAKRLNARTLITQCYAQLARHWEELGDYEKSLSNYKLYKLEEDSIIDQEMQGKLYQDQIRFETESKDFQIAELNKQEDARLSEMKRQDFIRNILAVVFALSMVLLITVYRSGQRRKEINKILLQHQEETELRSEELERLNAVKDKFFSIISHDLRSPINALAGLLDILDKGGISEKDMSMHIRELKTRFNHTRTLLNNLLDWTLLQMDKLNLQAAKINVKQIVDDNIQLIESITTKEIKLVSKIDSDVIAFADSNTFNLVVRNLITNALKFTEEGGQIEIGAKEKGPDWLIYVKDTGIGMSKDVIKILFDKTAPYTTRGTANEKGTGLGLILCKEFVEKNGGKIWVESEEGEGSTFWFTLPKS